MIIITIVSNNIISGVAAIKTDHRERRPHPLGAGLGATIGGGTALWTGAVPVAAASLGDDVQVHAATVGAATRGVVLRTPAPRLLLLVTATAIARSCLGGGEATETAAGREDQ